MSDPTASGVGPVAAANDRGPTTSAEMPPSSHVVLWPEQDAVAGGIAAIVTLVALVLMVVIL